MGSCRILTINRSSALGFFCGRPSVRRPCRPVCCLPTMPLANRLALNIPCSCKEGPRRQDRWESPTATLHTKTSHLVFLHGLNPRPPGVDGTSAPRLPPGLDQGRPKLWAPLGKRWGPVLGWQPDSQSKTWKNLRKSLAWHIFSSSKLQTSGLYRDMIATDPWVYLPQARALRPALGGNG